MDDKGDVLQPRQLFTELAEAVADGREPDWASADGLALDDADRALIAQLRAISEIGRCLATATLVSSTIDGVTIGRDVPAIWGTLRIRERVGRGRFGDVYRAWDPAIDRDVALKLLRRRNAEPTSSDSVVVHEARLMGRVRHPNVATIYGAAHADGRTGLWMEFIEGRTLEAELRDRGSFEPLEATQIGIELCRALSAVHGAGLVHRDVKAQNVMREVNGRVVLGDFGTGLEVEAEVAIALAGTPLYLAPELFNHAPATPQSDIYSLGVVLFHLLTGSYPVKGRTITDVKEAHAKGVRTRLRALRPDIHEPLAEVAERAIDPDPARRFVSASDMEYALVAAIAPLSGSTGGTTRDIASTAPKSSWVVVHANQLIGVSALILASALIAFGPIRTVLARFSRPPSTAQNAGGAVVETQKLTRVPAPIDQMFLGRPSPDGRFYTFTDLNGDLAIFDTATGSQRRLTDRSRSGGTAYQYSAFSSDGAEIAYSWQVVGNGWELRVIAVDGGAPRVALQSGSEIPHPVQWAPDGARILVLFEQPDGARRLALVSMTDGAITHIAPVDSGYSTASLSPDGQYVVFDNAQGGDAFERDIFIAAVDPPGRAVPLVTGDRDDFGPLWTADGAQVIFISDRTGEPSVWSVAVQNGFSSSEPVMLQRNVGRALPAGLTSNGTLYYVVTVGLVDVFVATMDFASARVVKGPLPVAPSHIGSNMTSAWSFDGRRVAYVSLPHAGSGTGRARRLAILDVETGATRMLSPPLSYYQFPRWSPDGRMILLKGVDLQSRRGVFVIDTDTGSTRAAALVSGRTPAEIGSIQWGADERTILFTRQNVGLMSLDLVTSIEHKIFDFSSEGITAITPNPGFRLSRDGLSIVYAAYRKASAGGDETVLRVKDLGRAPRDIAVGSVALGDWTPDGQVLFTQPLPKSNRRSLWLVPATGGNARAAGLDMVGLRDVSVHPDGRRITFTSGFPGSELWRLEKFLPSRL